MFSLLWYLQVARCCGRTDESQIWNFRPQVSPQHMLQHIDIRNIIFIVIAFLIYTKLPLVLIKINATWKKHWELEIEHWKNKRVSQKAPFRELLLIKIMSTVVTEKINDAKLEKPCKLTQLHSYIKHH